MRSIGYRDDGAQQFDLARDAWFREALAQPIQPTIGEITAIDGLTGQLTVDIDGNDDALAWPLDGVQYSVGEKVVLIFLSPSPGSGVAVGSRGSVPMFPAIVDHLAANNPHGLDAEDVGAVTEGEWTAIAYNTGWHGYDTANYELAYRTLGNAVLLRGVVERGSGTETVIGTLPSGLWPSQEVRFCVMTDAGVGWVSVSDTGEIELQSGGTGWVTLDGLIF